MPHTPDTQLIQKFCSDTWGCNVVLSRYNVGDKSIVLSEIQSKNPGQGKGTSCLQYVIKILTNMGVEKIWLLAKPINKDELDATRLAIWYMRNEFKIIKINLGDCGNVESAEMELVL